MKISSSLLHFYFNYFLKNVYIFYQSSFVYNIYRNVVM